MPQGYYKTITSKLKKNGFSYERNCKGSHELWADGDGKTVIVPKNTKSRHTANKVMNDAGINHRF